MIHLFIGFSTIFTIHFGYPYFWKHPYASPVVRVRDKIVDAMMTEKMFGMLHKAFDKVDHLSGQIIIFHPPRFP